MAQFNTFKHMVQAMGDHLLLNADTSDKDYLEQVVLTLAQYSFNAGYRSAMDELGGETPDPDVEVL